MKILYVSQYFPPEMGAPAARVSELARHWSRLGHQVTVLTGFPNHPTGELDPAYKKKFKRLVYRETYQGINVVRTWLLPFPNRKPHERILNYTSFWLSANLTGLFMEKPDVVIATSPQLLVGLVGWWLGKIKRVPFVFEVRDLWPDSIVASDVGEREGVMIRTLRAISGFLYRHADHIVVVTPAFKSDLIHHWKVSSEKISIVHNGVETELFSPHRKMDSASIDINLDGKFVVSYIGTHGLAHGLDLVLDAAVELHDRLPQVLFLLIGEGADKARLVSKARRLSLDNVRFLPLQPRQKIPAYIRASDACLVILKKRKVFKTVIPTKMLEFFASGRPVILGVDGQARDVLEAAEAGIFIPPEDVEELVRAVERLYRDKKLRQTLGKNGRQYVVNNLSRSQTAHQYINVLRHSLENS